LFEDNSLKKPSEGKIESAKKGESLNVSRILRELTKNEAFYFFTSLGDYTGEYAISLGDFVRKIKEVDIKSIEFHLSRGDFENWFTQTLEDKELAQEIRNLQKQNLTGESLRQKLHSTVSRRHEQLKRML
jgi:hypothetical protein